MSRPLSFLRLSLAVVLASAVGFGTTPSAFAGVEQGVVPDAIPSSATPNVKDGTVFSIAKVGTRVILGGDFTSVRDRNATSDLARTGILAFDATTGLVDQAFVPVLNGPVSSVIAGRDDTVYVTGNFTTVNGKKLRVARLNLSSGAVTPGWKGSTNSPARALALGADVLYVGGQFTKANGEDRAGFATMDPVTGANAAGPLVGFSGRHGTGTMKGELGPKRLVLSPDGTQIVATGNFTSVADAAGTVSRDQVALLDVGSGEVSVNRNWQTSQFTGQCANNAFDSWVSDVDIDPQGEYFVVASTGGSGTNTDGTRALCDSAARFELDGTGTNVKPTWIDWTGRDSLFSVAVTGTAVYVGGHQRWLNNPLGADRAAAGAVPRAGLGAMDVTTGMPLSWNPGRNPRGAGAYAILPADNGLYVGSDTNYIGDGQYFRGRVAHFPLATGQAVQPDTTGSFPGRLMAAGGPAVASKPEVLFRVNAAGPAVSSADGGPSWAADNSDPSAVRNSGSSIGTYSGSVPLDATVPSGTPATLFSTERWDPGARGDATEMKWSFPIQAGRGVKVRLYFANRSASTSAPGARKFDVAVEGSPVLTAFDVVAAAGHNVATMREFTAVSDGALDIAFAHVSNNPMVSAVEILQTDPAPPIAGDPTTLRVSAAVSESELGPLEAVATPGLDWSRTRGAFLVGSKMFYGTADNAFKVRTYDGAKFGPEVNVDPYNDPDWSTVTTGSGTAGQTYRGVVPPLYAQLSTVSSMFYANHRVYYTFTGQSAMYSRVFNPDSGVMDQQVTVTDGKSWSDVAGAFVVGDGLFFASRSSGFLFRVPWDGTKAVGTASLVDSSRVWSARSLFLVTDRPHVNAVPTAVFTVSCPAETLTCAFDGAASVDSDGSVARWDWDFGDGATSLDGGPGVTHTYAVKGSRQVTLTVTDDEGAPGQVTQEALPTSAPQQILFRDVRDVQSTGPGSEVSLPAAVEPGDVLLMMSTVNVGGATTVTPEGWRLEKTVQNGAAFVTRFYSRTAREGDAGATVTITFDNLGKATPKSTVSVLAYTGVDHATPVAGVSATLDAGSANHVAPAVEVAAPGSWVVNVWIDKASIAASQWTTPSALPIRSTVVGGGGAAVTQAVVDSGGPVPPGSYAEMVASTTTANSKGLGATVVLNAG